MYSQVTASSQRSGRSRSRSRSLPRKSSRSYGTRSAAIVRRIPRNLFGNINQIFRCQRTSTWQCGYNASLGFTQFTGAPYGSGIGFSFLLASVDVNSSTAGTFTACNTPNYTEFQAMFDYYRIRGVTIKMIYTNNVANGTSAPGGAASGIALPTVQCIPDQDDNTAPNADTELLQRPGVKLLTLGTNGPLVLKCKPQPAVELLTGAGVAPVGLGSRSMWLDVANAGIPHYGYKMFLTPWTIPSLQNGFIQFFFTYDLEFKGMR